MPSFPVRNETVFPIQPGSGVSMIAGRGLTGRFLTTDTPPSGGPDLQSRWDIQSVYIPVAVEANSDTASPLPTVCYLTLQMYVSAWLVWQQAQQLPLLATAAGSAWTAMATYADSMPNPIPFHNGQTFKMGYFINFDKPVVGSVGFVFITLAGQWTQDGAVATPAAIGYSEVFKPWTLPAPVLAQ